MLTSPINSRQIILVEYNPTHNWQDLLPNQNWLCVLVSDDIDEKQLDEAIGAILDKDVGYLCTIGKQCEIAHDLADWEIVLRQTINQHLHLPPHDVMTVWDYEFEEGIWFALFAAYDDKVAIDKVVFVDMTSGSRAEEVEAALAKFALSS